MPDIEICSICGKKVLISLYPWTKKQILCAICEEMEIQLKSTDGSIDKIAVTSSINTQRLIVDQRLDQEKLLIVKEVKAGSKQNEILITWSSVFMAFCGSLVFVSLLLFGLHLGKNGKKTTSMQELTPINSN